MKDEYLHLKPKDIKVNTRVRQDLGTLTGLAANIKKRGHLLQPIIITKDRVLVAGQRRLEAAKLAGIIRVACVVYHGIDSPIDLLEAESDENEFRKELTPLEKTRLGMMLELLERPKAKERQATSTGGNNPRPASGNLPEAGNSAGLGEVREKVADKIDMSPRTYEKAKEVVEAADAEPETHGDLANSLSEPRSVDAAHKELKKRQQQTHKRDELKDSTGEIVPDSLRDLFGDPWLSDTANKVAEALKVLSGCKRTVEKKSGAYGSFLLSADILKAIAGAAHELDTAKAHLLEGRPHAICPKCEGKKCQACRKSGWFPKWRYMELKAEGAL